YPKAYRGNAYVGDVMTNQVVEFRVTWRGSSPVATQHVLLDSSDRWFRPVDVKLGPDGAMYIADFYNRIIGHYEVPLDHPGRDRQRARIWRVIYRGAGAKDPQPMPDLSTADVKTLVDCLAKSNITLRMLAADQIADRIGAS